MRPRHVIGTVLLAASSCTAFADGAKTCVLESHVVRVVRGGESVTTIGTGGTKGSLNYNGAETTGDYAGAVCAVLLEDGASVTVDAGANGAASIWPAIIMTNGTATITVNASTLGMNRFVLLRGGAKLTVQGSSLKEVRIGHSDFCPYYELDGLTVMKGSTDITGKIFVNNSARLVSMPTKWLTDYTPGVSDFDGGRAYLMDSIYAQTSGTITALPGADIYLASPDILKGRTVSLGSGKTLHLASFRYKTTCAGAHASISNNLDELSAYIRTCLAYDAAGTNYAFDVSFADATGTLAIDENTRNATSEGSSFCGTVSGAGTVQAAFGPEVTAENAKTIAVSGTFGAFTGPIAAVCSNTTATVGTLVISNDLLQAAVTIGAGVQVICAPETDGMNVHVVEGLSPLAKFGAAAGKTVTIGTLSGQVRAYGDGAVVCTAVAPGTTLLDESPVTYPDGLARVQAISAAGDAVASQFADASGDADVGALVAALSQRNPYRVLRAAGGARLVNVPTSAVIDTETETPVLAETSTANLTLYGAGSAVFDRAGSEDWTNSVDFWFDFSDPANIRRVSSDADTPDSTKLAMTESYEGRKCPVFERCIDWRHPDREASLWQSLYYVVPTSANASLYPILATNMYQHAAGLSYMTLGNRTSGRLPFGFTQAKANNSEPMSAQYVVMVYSSRLGGGESLVADSKQIFRRQRGTSSVRYPFVTNALPAGLSIRADGKTIADPTTTCPNGDWQVVTLQMNGEEFRGLGFYGTNKQNGNGQSEYGEVLVFTNSVDRLHVLQAERYLAKKWNLTYDATEVDALEESLIEATTNVVTGVGTSAARVTAGGFATVRIEGGFAGEVALDGGRLVVDATLPWKEAQVKAVGNRTFWFDGDDRSSVKLVSDYRTTPMTSIESNQVRAVKDKFDADFRSGPLMAGISTRMPYLFREARRFGAVRNWIDFHEWFAEDLGPGNTMRLIQPWTGTSWEIDSNNPQTMSVQTILFAHDSTWGGGNPVYDSTAGNKHFGRRNTTNASSAVWVNGTLGCSAFRNGLNRIDGVTQTNPNGFGGKPEVYTVRGTEPIETQYFIDDYQNSTDPSVRKAVCVGEMIYYSTALDDTTIAGIESYLMDKWLGVLPEGFGDARQATVTGRGEVEVASLDRMPNIAADFAGTVTVAGETGEIAMTVDVATRRVNGAIVNDGATFALPATATIRVTFTGEDPTRQAYCYTLVDADGAEATTWSVDISDKSVPRGTKVISDAGKIQLQYTPSGLFVIVR